MSNTNKILVFLFGLLMAHSALADAGKILFSYGNVSVERQGRSLSAKQGFEIFAGDTIKTAKGAMAQIKLSDDSLIALKPETSWNLKTYSYDKNNPSLGVQSSNLIKGGLRAITGAVGKANPKNIKYAAGTATIGIRGTTFEMKTTLGGADNFVFVKVETGAVDIQTPTDSLRLNPNQTAMVLPNAEIQRVSAKNIFKPVNEILRPDTKGKKEYTENAESQIFMQDETNEAEVGNFIQPQQFESATAEQASKLEEELTAKPVKKFNSADLNIDINDGIIGVFNSFTRADTPPCCCFEKGSEIEYFATSGTGASSDYNYGNFLKYKGTDTVIGYMLDTSANAGYAQNNVNLNVNINEFYGQTITYEKYRAVKIEDLLNPDPLNVEDFVLKIDFTKKKIEQAILFYSEMPTKYKFSTNCQNSNCSIKNNGEFRVNFENLEYFYEDPSHNVKLDGKNNFAYLEGNILQRDFGVAMFAAQANFITDIVPNPTSTPTEVKVKHLGYTTFKKKDN